MSIQAYAPVSIGNFIVGFDVLGLALEDLSGEAFGDVVSIAPAARAETRVAGAYAHVLPADPTANIVHAARELVQDELSARGVLPREDFCLCLDKRLPVGSGLGSSAASIVAALVALNTWHGEAFSASELLHLAGVLEGRISGGVHYDNVAPSLLGGLQLILPEDGETRRLNLPETWRLVVHYPGIEVSTRAAREVLPTAYSRAEMVRFGQYLAAFVAAADAGDEAGMLAALRDELILPHRAPLVPGYFAAEQAARDAGALAFGLSGSGPTVFALCREAAMADIAGAIESAFPENPLAFTRHCRVDTRGARLL
ncbi:MAG: homoserine kinase [Gammaproteobacteria bacterium]|nr:homoserine kinase [Gammaproteobacteria bacterium]